MGKLGWFMSDIVVWKHKLESLYFMHPERIVWTHQTITAVIKLWENTTGSKSFGCIFSEKSADRIIALELEWNTLTALYDRLLRGRSWAKNESKVRSRIREKNIVRTKSNRVRGGKWPQASRRKKKRGGESLCFVVVESDLIFSHPCSHVICACNGFFVEVYVK